MRVRRRIPGLLSPARDILFGLAGFILTVVVLDSGGLAQWADRLDFGPLRTVALPATMLLDGALGPLGFDLARRDILAGLGRIGWSDDPEALAAAAPPPPLLPPPAPPRNQVAMVFPQPPPEAPPPPASQPATPIPVPPAPVAGLPAPPIAAGVPGFTVLPPLIPIAPGRPRQIALVGDSMMAVGLSAVLLRETASDRHLKLLKLFRSGTGLARPDVFDWMTEFPAMIGPDRPDLIIVAIGANDTQSYVDANGKILAFGSDAWAASYRARVTAFITMLQKFGTQIIWVGLPPMRAAVYDSHAQEINRITYTVVNTCKNAAWWNPDQYIGDEQGQFRDLGQVETPTGHKKIAHLRAPDGIHLSDDGASLLTQVLLPWLEPLPLPPPPAPPPN